MTDGLHLTSHVGRDLLQTSQLFRTPEAAIWEYVVNGLEYVDQGVRPEVHVRVDQRAKSITISDNGRGMSRVDLGRFFTMHGENIDRRRGRPGRGKFGTGKSAAFGIGRKLEVSTVHDGRRNVVALDLDAVEQSEGTAVPVRDEVVDEPTTAPNGTVIRISGVVTRIRTENVIRYIERHLAYWRSIDPIVAVDAHVCEPDQPAIASSHHFTPDEAQRRVLGDVSLLIEVAQAPLDAQQVGIAVTTGPGSLVAIETAGVDSKEFGNYLRGEVEVVALDEEGHGVAAYDASRSLQLNAQNPVAATLIGFIGTSVEAVRSELVARNRERRKEEEFRRLAEQADEIARVLNEDLRDVADRFEDLAAMRRREGDVARAGANAGGDDDDAYVEGDDEPGLLDPTDPPGEGDGDDGDGEDPELARRGTPDESGTDRVTPQGGDGSQRRPRGGLRVEYRNMGADEERSAYDSASKTILINLDHPMVNAALGDGGVDDIAFRRLSLEIAFSSYALALGQEMLGRDPDLSGDDLLFEVRDTLRRITRRAAALYR